MLLIGCKGDDVIVDPVPVIFLEEINQVKNVSDKDSIIEIVFHFEDGDGDIGLSESDTLPPFNFGSPYFHNLPIKYLVPDGSGGSKELENPVNNMPYGNKHQRVPVLTPTGKNKAISGNLKIKLTANPLNVKPEELKFEIKLLDRQLNVSNTLLTESLKLVH